MATLTQAKAAARAEAFARRKLAYEMGPGTAAHLSSVLAGHRGVSLAGYMAMRTEIDPLAAMQEAAAHGPVGVPVIMGAGQPLKFRTWDPDCVMIKGDFGALIPETGDWMEPEILIVPPNGPRWRLALPTPNKRRMDCRSSQPISRSI